MAKSTKSSTTKRATGKRELIKPKGDARYIRRDAKGRIKESDDMGRSLKQDRAQSTRPKPNPATATAATGNQVRLRRVPAPRITGVPPVPGTSGS